MTCSQWGTVGRHAPSCQCWATAPRGQVSVVPWRAKEGHSLKHRVVATVLGRRPRVAGRPVAAVPGNAPTLGRVGCSTRGRQTAQAGVSARCPAGGTVRRCAPRRGASARRRHLTAATPPLTSTPLRPPGRDLRWTRTGPPRLRRHRQQAKRRSITRPTIPRAATDAAVAISPCPYSPIGGSRLRAAEVRGLDRLEITAAAGERIVRTG